MKALFHNNITEPKSTLQKTKLARKLYDELVDLRDAKDVANWAEGEILYLLSKYGLHNYVFGNTKTRAAFYREIDIPVSTASFKIAIYEFFVVKHGLTFKQLQKANTKKLHRAIQYLRDADKDRVEEVVDLAEREKQSLGDFLVSIGAPDRWCVHQDKEKVEVEVCKECHKQVKKES